MHTLKIIVTKYLRCNVLLSRSFYANANGNGSKQNRQERDCVMQKRGYKVKYPRQKKTERTHSIEFSSSPYFVSYANFRFIGLFFLCNMFRFFEFILRKHEVAFMLIRVSYIYFSPKKERKNCLESSCAPFCSVN